MMEGNILVWGDFNTRYVVKCLVFRCFVIEDALYECKEKFSILLQHVISMGNIPISFLPFAIDGNHYVYR